MWVRAWAKDDCEPEGSVPLLFSLASVVGLIGAMALMAVIPFSDQVCLSSDADGGYVVQDFLAVFPRDLGCSQWAWSAQVIDLNVGAVYAFGCLSALGLSIVFAGTGSGNRFAHMGALRAVEQFVAYRLVLGLSLLAVLVFFGTLQLDYVVRLQGLRAWGVFLSPVSAALFFIASLAETGRHPFVGGEDGLIEGGYTSEYSGLGGLLMRATKYAGLGAHSALFVTIFLGGWQLPFVFRDGVGLEFFGRTIALVALPQVAVTALGLAGFVTKVIGICWLQLSASVWLSRVSSARAAVDAWRVLLPLALVNLVAAGGLTLLTHDVSEPVEAALVFAAECTRVVVTAIFVLVLGVIARRLMRSESPSVGLLGDFSAGSRL
jgi:NADH-quinone oxidoreductase subunit H